MLNNLSTEKQLAYLPSYLNVLFKLAARNSATIEEIDDWSCCAVFLPPGCSVDDPFTIPPWGILEMVKTLGIPGLMVSRTCVSLSETRELNSLVIPLFQLGGTPQTTWTVWKL